jgi:hypothetical protein
MRKLASRLARITVTVNHRGDLDPADYADPYPEGTTREDVWFWLLQDGFYTPERGIDLRPGEDADDSWGIIL